MRAAISATLLDSQMYSELSIKGINITAIASKKLRENAAVEEIYALPGNGGIARDAVCVPIDAKDIAGITDFAVKNAIDYAVVAPDDPLVLGCVDALEAKVSEKTVA